MNGGVGVVALVAPFVAVAVAVGRRARHPALAVDEALEIAGALGDRVARGRRRLLDLGGRGPGVRIAAGGGRDLLRPAVDPPLDLPDVPLRQQAGQRLGVLGAPAGVAEDDHPLVARQRRRFAPRVPEVDRMIGRPHHVEQRQPVERRVGVVGQEQVAGRALVVEVEVVRAAVVAVGIVEQRLGRPGGHRPRQVDDGRQGREVLRRQEAGQPAVVRRFLVRLGLGRPLPEIARLVVGEELLHDVVSHPLLDRIEAVGGAVDSQDPARRTRSHDSGLTKPVLGHAIVQEGPVGARHVEHELRHAVKRAAGVDLVERQIELHLGAVTVEGDGLVPGRRAVKLDSGVIHRFAVQVKNDRVIDGELGPALERRHILELGVDRRPLRRADIHGICPQRPFVEQVGAGTGDDGAVRPNRRHGPVSLGTRAAATAAQRHERRRRDHSEKFVSPVPPDHRCPARPNVQQTRCPARRRNCPRGPATIRPNGNHDVAAR